jgi:hypothetical protein
MAITVISRPIGNKLNTSLVDGVIVDDGTGDARVYVASGHGLQDGDYVYIISNFDSYNGFKYVDSTAYDYFKIKNSSGEDFVRFVQESDIEFYVSALNHGWQCVHLPIVYELESSLFPNNTADTERKITAVTDSNGYCNITVDGDIKATGSAAELEYISIDGVSIEGVNGVYQIIDYISDTNFVIDLAYSSAVDGDLTINGYAHYYYNNYHFRVRVYAGLTAAHRWEDEKPYELAGELKLIPDDNNRAKFSISEILKGYINLRNNLTLDTLPNNLDFYTQFYISYSENYDDSDGTTITISEGAFTSDQANFEGHAINAMLPFKSQNISFLSDYLNEDDLLAQWLTVMDRPVMVIGRFFDLSFINQYNGTDIHVVVNKRLNGLLQNVEVIILENPGTGILRVPFIPESGYDEYCIYATAPGESDAEPIVLPELSTFVNVAVPNELSWTTGATPSVLLNGAADESSKSITGLYNFVNGSEYDITIRVSSSAAWIDTSITVRFFDNANSVITSQIFSGITGAAGSTIERTAGIMGFGNITKVGVAVNRPPTAAGTSTYTLLSISGVEYDGEVSSTQITEQICCDVVEECDTFVES